MGSRKNIAGMESTTGDPLPYLGILCRMIVKNEVFNVFAHGVAKPEIMRLSPVANHRFTDSQPNAMKFPKNRLIAGESYNIDWEVIIVLNYCYQQAVSMLAILVSAKGLSL